MRTYLIFGIFAFISAKHNSTAKQIAQHFEISTRTVYRYIDALIYCGIPIQTILGKGGGITLEENFRLESVLYSSQEKSALKNAIAKDTDLNDEAILKNLLKFL